MRAYRSKPEQDALYGLAAETIAELAHVHVTTARRWKRYGDAPYATVRLIEILTTGNLGRIDPSWSGWSIRKGKLISPDNMSFSTGDVLAIPFVQQLVASYQADQRMARQADWISETWVPARAVNE